MTLFRSISTVLLGASLALGTLGCTGSGQTAVADEGQAGWQAGAMAATANPHATEAALVMLRRGGHAVDAAIAAHAVLGLVEPQSSGIGGGAFMLVYQRDEQAMVFHDGRETAPQGATADMFMLDGKVMNFVQAWQSGMAVGVPGTVALYEGAHKERGKLPWADLFQPAIRLASEGFKVSPRLADYLPRIAKMSRLDENPGAAAYFYPGGKALQAGDLLKNPEYAATLKRIAKEGSSAFYRGEIAQAIAAAAQAEPNPGTLSVEDIASYRTVQREAVCGPYRQLKLCGATPPASSAAVIMMMGLYEQLAEPAADQNADIAAFVDAQRLAYADRDQFFGDPDAVSIPLRELLDPRYLEHRAGQRFAPDGLPTHGEPGVVVNGREAAAWATDTTDEIAGTTHLSIVDGEGNSVAMTATVEAPFGSARWVAGFLLNNEMTDFARDYAAGTTQANQIAPGRRPRSSMSPMLVFDERGELLMVTGSPGGNSIPAYVFKSLVGVLDWKMTPQQAIEFPNIIARGKDVRVEVSGDQGQAIADYLDDRGYSVLQRKGENSGLHVILVDDGRLVGAADPRREGTVGQVPVAP